MPFLCNIFHPIKWCFDSRRILLVFATTGYLILCLSTRKKIQSIQTTWQGDWCNPPSHFPHILIVSMIEKVSCLYSCPNNMILHFRCQFSPMATFQEKKYFYAFYYRDIWHLLLNRCSKLIRNYLHCKPKSGNSLCYTFDMHSISQ